MARVREFADYVQELLIAQTGEPLAMLRAMKFETVGFHPINHRPINFVEQINQTWTFTAALAAARQLLASTPTQEAFALRLARKRRSRSTSRSEQEGLVGAEVFAAVWPHSNGKLEKDLDKLKGRPEKHRYVFFISLRFPGNKRQFELERDGIEVWSVDV